MHDVIVRWGLVGFMVISALILGSQAKAEEWKTEQGGTEAGKVMLGMRAGFAPLTQQLTFNTSTDVGSLVNFQAMYSLNKWLLAGMMLEWERHSIGSWSGRRSTLGIKTQCLCSRLWKSVRSSSARSFPTRT